MRTEMAWLTPEAPASRRTLAAIAAGWVGLWLALWATTRLDIFPSPLDVLGAFPALWLEQGLGQEILASLRVNLEALVLSAAIALPIAYLSRVPLVRPVAAAVGALRVVSPVVFYAPLLFLTSSGHEMKLAMLVVGEVFFLVMTVTGIVQSLPAERFDDARTLRLSTWRATWYVAVRGTLDQVLDAIRDNAGMGWAAVIFVEGIVRAEGGVGVLIVNKSKYLAFADVYAIVLLVLAVGLAQDQALGLLRRAVCPWSAR